MNNFCVDAETALPCQQSVVGISFIELQVAQRGLAISMAHNDRPQDVLHVPRMGTFSLPSGTHEFGGEPIQQFRMAWPFTLRAQVVERFRNPDAEELSPLAVVQQPGGLGGSLWRGPSFLVLEEG